jgi:hypothetical protein
MVQSVDPFPENGFQNVKADFVQKFSHSRKKFICRPNLLSLDTVFEMPKQEKLKEVKFGKYGGCGCTAIRKKLSL